MLPKRLTKSIWLCSLAPRGHGFPVKDTRPPKIWNINWISRYFFGLVFLYIPRPKTSLYLRKWRLNLCKLSQQSVVVNSICTACSVIVKQCGKIIIFFFLLAVFVLKTHASQGTCDLEKKKVRSLSYARMGLTGSKVACIKIRVFNILDYTPRIAKTNMKQFHLITKFVFVPFVCSFIYDFYFLFPSFRFHF